ncbi:hypothetical protein IVA87_29360 [Bradyrhizobium sp. 147]|uniref:hypothetical protein n=1 Tax=Bradyrhizobium sp. 147 TaxID=2782623 RepID=UPI001FFB14C1|nr:hypothetical protein [Bradyrhizobium sp. 147]MCK1683401.1 hypothetical protein [Bradyrhizobium sp. 147]
MVGRGSYGPAAELRLAVYRRLALVPVQPMDAASLNEDVRRMRTLLKIVLVAVCAAILTALLLIMVLGGIFGMQWSRTLQILSSATGLYLPPTIIFIEFYFLVNDLLAYICRKYEPNFGLNFSEIPFKFDLDNFETPIPLETKLVQLYPLTILLLLLGLVVALTARQ